VTYPLKLRGDEERKNLVAASWLRRAASVKSERYPESMASFLMEDVEFLDFRPMLSSLNVWWKNVKLRLCSAAQITRSR
jgi:hypothetical protein